MNPPALRLLIAVVFGLSLLAAVCLACFSGVVLGMTAAVTGGWFDAVLSRLLDALNSIPSKNVASCTSMSMKKIHVFLKQAW